MGKNITETLPADTNSVPFAMVLPDPSTGSVISRWKVAKTETENSETIAIPAVAPIAATAVTEYAVSITLANTEYSQAVTNARKVIFRCRHGDNADIRYARTTGKVAGPTDPYHILPYGSEYVVDGIDYTGTFYFASSTAGVVVEMEVWT